MKDNYDFSQSIKNPYVSQLPKKVTIELKEDVFNYFNQLAEEMGISYESLMSLYLQDCVQHQRKPKVEWVNQTQ